MSQHDINLIPSELQAIEEHKYYLSEKEGREVTIDEAILDFQRNYEESFLQAKQQMDNLAQREEIMKYKWIESEKQGHDIGARQATLEWIEKYALVWRREKESLERCGFVRRVISAHNGDESGIDMQALRDIATTFDADIYLHKDGMEFYNFLLCGRKKYLSVRSMLSRGNLDVAKGERIDLIATGSRAGEALDEVEKLFIAAV